MSILADQAWQSKVEGVQIWDPLKEHQLLLLRRIGDGSDLSGPDGLDQRPLGSSTATPPAAPSTGTSATVRQ